MLNKEKYAKEIVEMAINNEVIALKDNKPINCRKIKCNDCGKNDLDEGCTMKKLKEWANSEYKELILDEAEKRYLAYVIRPFRDKVSYITKHSDGREWIVIEIINDVKISFPYFKKGSMYRGMELYKNYTIEELGL